MVYNSDLMVRNLEQRQMDERAREQERDIERRREFMTSNISTKQTIINLLNRADEIILESKGSTSIANLYIRQTISRYRYGTVYEADEDFTGGEQYPLDVDWDEVEFQIIPACFSDSDMGGLYLVERRVWSELIILKSLMEDCQEYDNN